MKMNVDVDHSTLSLGDATDIWLYLNLFLANLVLANGRVKVLRALQSQWWVFLA